MVRRPAKPLFHLEYPAPHQAQERLDEDDSAVSDHASWPSAYHKSVAKVIPSKELPEESAALKVESWATVPGDTSAAKGNDNEPTANRAGTGIPGSPRMAPRPTAHGRKVRRLPSYGVALPLPRPRRAPPALPCPIDSTTPSCWSAPHPLPRWRSFRVLSVCQTRPSEIGWPA